MPAERGADGTGKGPKKQREKAAKAAKKTASKSKSKPKAERKSGAAKGGSKAAKGGQGKQAKKKDAKKKDEPEFFTGPEEQRMMKAFQNSLRVKITAVMNELPEASPKLLGQLLPDEDEGKIAYHVRRLKFYRIIVPTKTVPRRGATEHWYKAVARAMIPPAVWDRVPDLAQHEISVGILRELWADIYDAMKGGTFEDPESHLSITPMILDRQGVTDSGVVVATALEALLAIQEEVNGRMKKNGTPDSKGIAATVGLVLFQSMRSPANGIRASQTKRL